MTEPIKKTPKEAKKKADQDAFDAKVQVQLDKLSAEVDELDAEHPDAVDVATLYRSLVAVKETVVSCPPPLRKQYNKIVTLLFAHMDVVPGSMLISEEDGRP